MQTTPVAARVTLACAMPVEREASTRAPAPAWMRASRAASVSWDWTALAADWLVSAWDQCAGFHSLSRRGPRRIEEISWARAVRRVARERTRRASPPPATPCTRAPAGMSSATGSPVRRASTSSVASRRTSRSTGALPLLGLGGETPIRVRADAQRWIDSGVVESALAAVEGPTIVCAQAGNVATGTFDPFEPIADACAARGAWVHVDGGTFGQWAVAPSTRAWWPGSSAPTHGLSTRTSGSTCPTTRRWRSSPTRTRAAMSMTASFLVVDARQRDPASYGPSRRGARAVPVCAALRSLRRSGVAELVERNCAHARRMAARIAEIRGRRSSTTSSSSRGWCGSPAATTRTAPRSLLQLDGTWV